MQKKVELLEEIIADLLLGYPTPTSLKVKRLQAELASLPKEQSVTDEEIEAWAKGTLSKYKEVEIGVNLTDSDIRGFITHAKITGAKAHRDGQIPKK